MSRVNLRTAGLPALAVILGFAGHYYASRAGGTNQRATDATQNAPASGADLLSASPTAAELDRATSDGELAGKTALSESICGFLGEYASWPESSESVTSTAPLACLPKEQAAAGLKKAGAGGNHAPAVTREPRVAGKLHVLLAVVPDPARTHLELRFDRAMDDLQDAAHERGWDFDSDWLPWDSRSHAESDRYGERLLDQAARRGRERAPGVLLFRPANRTADPDGTSADAPLLVLVVGDSPIAGINADQFRTGLALWRSLLPLNKEPGELRILGPSYSGSVQSLVHLLPQELAVPPLAGCGSITVSVASGSITSSSQIEQLGRVCPNSHFVSFDIDGVYEQNSLLRYLQAKDAAKRVALLVEQKTTYGHSQSAPYDPKKKKKGTTGTPSIPEPTLILSFPPEISQLREAYEESGIIGFGDSADEPRSQLQFTTTEKPRGTDTVPSFSGTQRTLSIESEMEEIAATLSREHIDTVLLSATDVFDEIFVARYLQQHAPRVTVIIQDSDILFLRRGQDAGLQDTYFVSPWPLIPENQAWTAAVPGSSAGGEDEDRKRSIYTSRGDEGAIAAARFLLPCPPSGTCSLTPPEYRSPLPSDGVFQQRPPLWLSMIGRGMFAPVALVDADQAAIDTKNATNLPLLPAAGVPAGISARVQFQTKLLGFGIALLLVWHGLACIFSRLDRRFGWSYALADAGQRKHRLWAQAILCFVAIAALRLLKIPGAAGFAGDPNYLWGVIGPLQGVAAGLAAWPMARWWALGGESRKNQLWSAFGVAAAVNGCLAVIIDLAVWPVLMASSWPSERVFLLYRSALMVPGISPAFTLLLFLAAFAFWGQGLFSRWAFFGHRIPDLPGRHDQDLHCPSPKFVAGVTNLFTTPKGEPLFHRSHWPNYCIAAGSLLVVVLAIRISGGWGPTSLDNKAFCYITRMLTVLLAAAIVNDIGVAVWGWTLLRQRCLLPLKYSPLRWGFTWIKGFSWRKVWTSLYVLSPELVFDYLSRLLEANSRTRLHDDCIEQARKKLVKLYYYSTAEDGTIMRKNDQWSEEVAKSLRHLYVLLAHRADVLLDYLKLQWVQDRGPLTGSEDPERGVAPHNADDKQYDAIAALDRKAAEEFVALVYLGYIRMVLIQIRNRVMTALICYVLLLWALTSYPWTNHHAIIVGLSVLLAALSLGVVYVYSGMHRDEILSRTTETDPGKLDPEFFEKTIPTLGLPLLSLVATQFPEFSDLIFSWIEPGLRGH